MSFAFSWNTSSRRWMPLVAAPLTLAALLAAGSVFAPVCAAQAAPPVSAPHDMKDVSGDWQGTIQTPGAALRTILKVSKGDKGWTVKMYSIDQGSFALNGAASLDGSAFKYSVDSIGGTYAGTLSPDGNLISGNWTQGGTAMPLNLLRATKETAWEIPAPPPPPKKMAADANPAFDVATIKPNDSGGATMQGLTLQGRNFATRNSSLADLISFAYQVQRKQIVGAPDWIEKDRYDIAAVPDTEGDPSPEQLRMMIRKLMADRFKLAFHKDKRELSAFVLTVGKGGQKLRPTELKGTLPGLLFQPAPSGLMLVVRNGLISDFTNIMQSLVLDRPVVDSTGIQGRYDFSVTFTPDDSQFSGHPPTLPARADTVEAAPGLFAAIQQQIGLKLDAQKTAVEVLAVDHVDKPSAN